MKVRKMKEQNFYDPISNDNATLPWSLEEAIALGFTRYMDRDGCEKCKKDGRPGKKVRYVIGGGCSLCLNHEVNALWPQWLQGDPSRPDPWIIKPTEGVDWYYASPNHPLVCEKGPHLRRTHIHTGRCLACVDDAARLRAMLRGPRAIARAAGDTQYLPTDPCPTCGQIAPRSVSTNVCSACKPPDRRRSESQIFAEQNPDLILTKEGARAIGFTLYRTGEPCRKGHTGWRYVSTGNCLECLK